MLQWPWGLRWSLRGDSYSSGVNVTPGVYWVRTWGRAPARPVSHNRAESVLVAAFLQRHTVCAGSGHLHLDSRLWWVASQAFTAPGEQASLLKPHRPLGSILRVRPPAADPVQPSRVVLSHHSPGTARARPGPCGSKPGLAASGDPVPTPQGKAPGTPPVAMALCMGTCPDHGPGRAEVRAVLSALCSAGGEACCGQPAGLGGCHGEGGEVPAEVLGQTADAAAPALVSVPWPQAQTCRRPPLRGKRTPPVGRAPDHRPRYCCGPLPIPPPPRALGRSAALPDAPVPARHRGDALGDRGDGGPRAWPSTP